MTTPMNRREAVRNASLLIGGALVVSSGVLSGCTTERKPAASGVAAAASALTADDQALIEAIADTILPETAASPGAKAAGAGREINLLLTDCFPADAQQRVRAGLTELRARCTMSCSTGFATMAPADRESLLRTVDADATKAGPTHWFHLVRELSQRAYFSSEIGMTKALRYVREPGGFTGCVPLTSGQPAWS